jgi:TorA maturation chaperone TorD
MNVTPERLQLLALLLGAPQDGSLEVLEALAGEHPWLAAPLDELRGVPLAQWQGEHTALFVNGYPKTAAPPFISALRHGQMGGGAEEELLGFYRRLGLEPNGVPADYLGTLFECAAWLLSQQEQRQGELDELWQNYMLPILPEFSQRLIEQGRLRLYREMGKELKRIYSLVATAMEATA